MIKPLLNSLSELKIFKSISIRNLYFYFLRHIFLIHLVKKFLQRWGIYILAPKCVFLESFLLKTLLHMWTTV